jgi:hypothetical protein
MKSTFELIRVKSSRVKLRNSKFSDAFSAVTLMTMILNLLTFTVGEQTTNH